MRGRSCMTIHSAMRISGPASVAVVFDQEAFGSLLNVQRRGTWSGRRGYTMAEMTIVTMTSDAGYHLRIALSSGLGPGLHPVEQVFDESLEHRRIELVDDLLALPLGE